MFRITISMENFQSNNNRRRELRLGICPVDIFFVGSVVDLSIELLVGGFMNYWILEDIC